MALINKRTLLALAVSAAVSLPAYAEFFCCQDPTSGRRSCGDSLPDICRGRAYKIMDSGGNIIKEVGPPLTAEQKAAQAAELQRKKEQDEQARELRRKDQALLDTYSSLKDIDIAEEKAVNDVKLNIRNADLQIEAIRAKRKKFEDEAEFYKKKALPPEVERGLALTAQEIKQQEENREQRKKDFAAIKAKYDGDRQRYIELTSKRRPASGIDDQPPVATSRPR